MQDDMKKTLSKVRLEHAYECLKSAKILLETNDYKGAANRSYYAIYHAMRSVLALDGIDMKKHSGTISEFRRLYIATQVFERSMSKTISQLFDIRTNSDYDDFYVAAKTEVEEQVQGTEEFVETISNYLSNH
jgi:uncharacterized protein (UPF0332 family)